LGAVFDSGDVSKDRRKIFQNAMKDLRPETKERIVKIFETWKGRTSEKELEELIGSQRAKKFRELVDKSSDELSSNELDNLRRLFRESVTFD
jgi:thiaminase